jgi:hypothetical protein
VGIHVKIYVWDFEGGEFFFYKDENGYGEENSSGGGLRMRIELFTVLQRL